MVTLPTTSSGEVRRREGHRDPAPAREEIDAIRFDPGDGTKIDCR